MKAIVQISGQQFRAEEGKFLYVPHIQGEQGKSITCKDILMIIDEGEEASHVGHPYVENSSIQAKILEHIKGDKCIVFKKKRRKGYKVKRGHRQLYTKLLVERIQSK